MLTGDWMNGAGEDHFWPVASKHINVMEVQYCYYFIIIRFLCFIDLS